MSFKPGNPGGPGRPKGYTSPRTKALEIIMMEHGYNPVKELLKLLPTLDERDAAKVHLELMQYIYPKRKEQTDQDLSHLPPEEQAAKVLEDIKERYPQLMQSKNE